MESNMDIRLEKELKENIEKWEKGYQNEKSAFNILSLIGKLKRENFQVPKDYKKIKKDLAEVALENYDNHLYNLLEELENLIPLIEKDKNKAEKFFTLRDNIELFLDELIEIINEYKIKNIERIREIREELTKIDFKVIWSKQKVEKLEEIRKEKLKNKENYKNLNIDYEDYWWLEEKDLDNFCWINDRIKEEWVLYPEELKYYKQHISQCKECQIYEKEEAYEEIYSITDIEELLFLDKIEKKKYIRASNSTSPTKYYNKLLQITPLIIKLSQINTYMIINFLEKKSVMEIYMPKDFKIKINGNKILNSKNNKIFLDLNEINSLIDLVIIINNNEYKIEELI